MLINGLGKEGSLLLLSLIQSRTIPGCGGGVTFPFKRGEADTQLLTIEVLKGMGGHLRVHKCSHLEKEPEVKEKKVWVELWGTKILRRVKGYKEPRRG